MGNSQKNKDHDTLGKINFMVSLVTNLKILKYVGTLLSQSSTKNDEIVFYGLVNHKIKLKIINRTLLGF